MHSFVHPEPHSCPTKSTAPLSATAHFRRFRATCLPAVDCLFFRWHMDMHRLELLKAWLVSTLSFHGQSSMTWNHLVPAGGGKSWLIVEASEQATIASPSSLPAAKWSAWRCHRQEKSRHCVTRRCKTTRRQNDSSFVRRGARNRSKSKRGAPSSWRL
ncbi:hypothetical protein BC567DRAFT_221083 [Phyllosticta citribraziliensis]